MQRMVFPRPQGIPPAQVAEVHHLFHKTVLFWGLLLAGLLGGISLEAAQTRSVMLTWDGAPEGASGYRVYYGTAPGHYTSSVEAGDQTTVTLTGLRATQAYYFVVTVYDAAHLESEPSEEAFVPPAIGVALVGKAANGVVNQNGNVPLGVTFTGSDEAGVQVELFANSAKIGETNQPPYQFDWRTAQPGTYHLVAVVSDGSGEVMRSPTVTVTVVKFAVEQIQRSPTGEIRLTIIGAPQHRNRVYFSENLAQWALLKTVDNVDGTVEVQDAEATQSKQRFYRVEAEAL